MSEQNKLIARRFLAAFAAGDTATLTKSSPKISWTQRAPGASPARRGCSAQSPCSGGVPRHADLGRSQSRRANRSPCGRMGTNTGPMMGRPATGKPADVGYMDMCRIANGQIVEVWHVEDIAGMLTQLGLTSG